MIGLLTQNNTILSCLTSLLADFNAQAWSPDLTCDAILLAEPLPSPLPEFNAPIITLGLSHPDELLHIKTPVSPDTLRRRIQSFLDQNRQMPVFENKSFLFIGRNRSLLDKKSDTLIRLTEKENALLCCLATAAPAPLSKETLLSAVWNYHPDTETHTLESHIYSLRQKIGSKADSLIQYNSTGYTLVTD